jgi:uncharacterized membrane protein YidH (DUF202 family)
MTRSVVNLPWLATVLALALVVGGTVLGGLAVAFGESYTTGQYVHDLALFVLGLGAIVFASTYAHHSLVTARREGTTLE